jgi:hypothetical protein
MIEFAEAHYSKGRLEALRNEWSEVYPGLDIVFEAFRGLRGSTSVAELASTDRIQAVIEEGERLSKGERPKVLPVSLVAYDMISAEWIDIWTMIAEILFEIGFLGVKPSAQETVIFGSDEDAELTGNITRETRLVVHPMFSRALGINAFAEQ